MNAASHSAGEEHAETKPFHRRRFAHRVPRCCKPNCFTGICEDEGGQFLVCGDYAPNGLGNFEKSYQDWPKDK